MMVARATAVNTHRPALAATSTWAAPKYPTDSTHHRSSDMAQTHKQTRRQQHTAHTHTHTHTHTHNLHCRCICLSTPAVSHPTTAHARAHASCAQTLSPPADTRAKALRNTLMGVCTQPHTRKQHRHVRANGRHMARRTGSMSPFAFPGLADCPNQSRSTPCRATAEKLLVDCVSAHPPLVVRHDTQTHRHTTLYQQHTAHTHNLHHRHVCPSTPAASHPTAAHAHAHVSRVQTPRPPAHPHTHTATKPHTDTTRRHDTPSTRDDVTLRGSPAACSLGCEAPQPASCISFIAGMALTDRAEAQLTCRSPTCMTRPCGHPQRTQSSCPKYVHRPPR